MSGGSFGYLCHAEAEELFEYGKRIELGRMAVAIGTYPDGHAASVDTHELVAYLETVLRRVEAIRRRLEPVWHAAYLETVLRRVEAIRRRLEPVWHAVEWHQSSDCGPDQVAEALRKYYGVEEPS